MLHRRYRLHRVPLSLPPSRPHPWSGPELYRERPASLHGDGIPTSPALPGHVSHIPSQCRICGVPYDARQALHGGGRKAPADWLARRWSCSGSGRSRLLRPMVVQYSLGLVSQALSYFFIFGPPAFQCGAHRETTLSSCAPHSKARGDGRIAPASPLRLGRSNHKICSRFLPGSQTSSSVHGGPSSPDVNRHPCG